MRRPFSLLAALLLAACGSAAPEPARPALWHITSPGGAQGWLFGTIHALEKPVQWRTPQIDAALSASDRIVVEVANVSDGVAMAEAFSRLSRSHGLAPLPERIGAMHRPALQRLLKQTGKSATEFADVETWAAALVLAQASQPKTESRHGIDRAVLSAANGKPVLELEGAIGQLGLFDTLPEKEQRDLLTLVVTDEEASTQESAALSDAWARGDFAVIERETRRGLLADPELREVLFTQRNRAWTATIADLLAKGARPFVAVGAAHMAGPDGLGSMLSAKGFTVKRIQ
jgi:uncharacterized protein YbaP (TraB family)